MGNNICMRCGKPCGPNETMCDECRAWLAQKTAGNDAQKNFKKIRVPGQSHVDVGKTFGKKTETGNTGGQFCTKCGKQMPEGVNFCTSCGNPLRGAEQPQSSTGDNGKAAKNERSGFSGKSGGSDTKKILIAAAVVIVCVVLIFGVKMLVGSKKASDEMQQASLSEDNDDNGIGKAIDEETEEEKAAREKAEEEERAKAEQEANEQAEREAEEKAKQEMAIHNYEIVVRDCTWQEAYDDCKSRGGYLVRINSAEEYNHIVSILNNYKNIHFYLGGKREADGTEYYWVDNDGAYMEECINPDNSWTSTFWFQNEPSYADAGSGAQGQDIEEAYMNLFCVSSTWYLNDSSSNLAGDYPNLFAGKVGYIVEYE